MIKVKEWSNYFLRDDSEIRKESGMFPVEAYSLFKIEPYGRIVVFATTKNKAIKQAEEIINENRRND